MAKNQPAQHTQPSEAQEESWEQRYRKAQAQNVELANMLDAKTQQFEALREEYESLKKRLAQPQPQTPVPTGVLTAGGKDGASIILPGGERRVDYIRRRFYQEGISRGQIAKELTEIMGKPVAYQIVFSATKKKTLAEAVAAQTTGEAPAAALAAEADEAHAEAAEAEGAGSDAVEEIEELPE